MSGAGTEIVGIMPGSDYSKTGAVCSLVYAPGIVVAGFLPVENPKSG